MILKKFSKREKFIFNIAVVLASAVILFNFMVKPIFNFIEASNKEIERKSFLLEKYFHVVERGEMAVSLYESHKHALEGGQDSQEVVSELFSKIESIAVTSGVIIKRVKPSNIIDNGSYKEAMLDIELEGKFSNFFSFIDNLETAPYFVRILSFSLLSQSRSSKQLRCRISLSKIFF